MDIKTGWGVRVSGYQRSDWAGLGLRLGWGGVGVGVAGSIWCHILFCAPYPATNTNKPVSRCEVGAGLGVGGSGRYHIHCMLLIQQKAFKKKRQNNIPGNGHYKNSS